MTTNKTRPQEPAPVAIAVGDVIICDENPRELPKSTWSSIAKAFSEYMADNYHDWRAHSPKTNWWDGIYNQIRTKCDQLSSNLGCQIVLHSLSTNPTKFWADILVKTNDSKSHKCDGIYRMSASHTEWHLARKPHETPKKRKETR